MGDSLAHQAPDPAVAQEAREKRIRDLMKDPMMNVPEPDSGIPKVQEKDIVGLTSNGTLDDALKKTEEPKPEEKKAEVKQDDLPKPEVKEEPKPEFLKGAFEKLAKEKAEVRALKESMKGLDGIAQVFDPGTLTALARARAAGDKLGMLAALGLSYSEIASEVIEKAPVAGKKSAASEPPEENPALTEVRRELAELRAERAVSQRQTYLGRIKEVSGGFRYLSAVGSPEMVESYLTDFHRRTGTLPGDTFDESVKIAAEAVEQNLKVEAEKWSKILTKPEGTATLPSSGTSVPPQAGKVTSGKTLTNAAVAPRTAAPEPASREERMKSLLNDPNLEW